jgi:hypothetical protein
MPDPGVGAPERSGHPIVANPIAGPQAVLLVKALA